MKIKELMEKRAALGKTIRDFAEKLHAESRSDFTPEEKPNWEKLNGDFDALTRQIKIAERAEAVASEMATAAAPAGGLPGRDDSNGQDQQRQDARNGAPAATAEDHATAMQAWCRSQLGMGLTERQAEAARRVGMNLQARELEIPLFRRQPRKADFRSSGNRENRALSVVAGASGGFITPESFVNNLERAMLQFGGMRQAAEVMRTAGGNDMPWPTANDTTNKGAIVGENTAVTNQDVSFGQKVWRAYKYTSKMILVPVELLEDTVFDLPSILGEMMGERIGRIQNDHFTTGTGAAQPYGVVTGATLGKTTAGATAITWDEVFDLLHSVDPAYRGNASFMMHDNLVVYLRKLKDSQNRYLWQPSLTDTDPDRICGFPVVVNQSMQSTVATATKTMLFGDFSKYKIRDVSSIRIRRLVERYADADQEGFVAFARADGNLLDAGVAPVKYMLQA